MIDLFVWKLARERVRYDPISGVFTWKTASYGGPRGYIRCGEPAGYIDPRDFRKYIGVAGKLLRSSRLAYFIMTNRVPFPEVDHIDGNPGNDCWLNLRRATSRQQKINRRTPRTNTSGVKGVCFDKLSGKWKAQIAPAVGKTKHIGLFADKFDAGRAYRREARRLYGAYRRAA